MEQSDSVQIRVKRWVWKDLRVVQGKSNSRTAGDTVEWLLRPYINRPFPKQGGVRREVMEFAILMEDVLRDNDWKGGWNKMSHGELVGRAQEELDEVKVAAEYWGRSVVLRKPDIELQKALMRECADVANFMMMVYDNFAPKRLKETVDSKFEEKSNSREAGE